MVLMEVPRTEHATARDRPRPDAYIAPADGQYRRTPEEEDELRALEDLFWALDLGPRHRVELLEGRIQVSPKPAYWHERVVIWLHPWTTHTVFCPSTGTMALRQDCQSYQLVKSLYSIANGGFGGTGLGKGTFTTTDGHQLIPYVNTDFIYSALAQELGLVGVSALLLVYMVFVARGMKIALQADEGFSKLLAAGLTFGFALQTYIIVGGVLRVIPLTGITLPFVSYGGSSVVANFLVLAGLLLVSDRANSGVR